MQDALLIPTYSSRVRYTFQGVDVSKTPASTFMQNDNEVSYAAYYRCCHLCYEADMSSELSTECRVAPLDPVPVLQCLLIVACVLQSAGTMQLTQPVLLQEAVRHQGHQHGPASSSGCKQQQYATNNLMSMHAPWPLDWHSCTLLLSPTMAVVVELQDCWIGMFLVSGLWQLVASSSSRLNW